MLFLNSSFLKQLLSLRVYAMWSVLRIRCSLLIPPVATVFSARYADSTKRRAARQALATQPLPRNMPSNVKNLPVYFPHNTVENSPTHANDSCCALRERKRERTIFNETGDASRAKMPGLLRQMSAVRMGISMVLRCMPQVDQV